MRAKGDHVSTLWRLTSVSVTLACVFAAVQAEANGTAPAVIAGQAGFSTQGSTLNITNSPGAMINWQGFSIGAGETTRFVQQSVTSSVLNRVRRITTPSGGSVYLVGANVSNSGLINSPQGEVILAAGQSVNIFDSSTPGVRAKSPRAITPP